MTVEIKMLLSSTRLTNDLAAGGVFAGEALDDFMDGRGATESLDLSGGAGILRR